MANWWEGVRGQVENHAFYVGLGFFLRIALKEMGQEALKYAVKRSLKSFPTFPHKSPQGGEPMTLESKPLMHQGDRQGHAITKVIVHWTVTDTLDAALRALTSKGTSYHYMVKDDVVWNLVPVEKAAWHAGDLTVNRESIGISIVGSPTMPPSPESHKTVAKLIAQVAAKDAVILGHKNVKATQCPGSVNLDWIREEVGRLRAATLAVVEAPIVTETTNQAFKSFATEEDLFRFMYAYGCDVFLNRWPRPEDEQHAVDVWKASGRAAQDAVNPILKEQYRDELAPLTYRYEQVTENLFRKIN